MVTATVLAIYLVPVFFVVIRRRFTPAPEQSAAGVLPALSEESA